MYLFLFYFSCHSYPWCDAFSQPPAHHIEKRPMSRRQKSSVSKCADVWRNIGRDARQPNVTALFTVGEWVGTVSSCVKIDTGTKTELLQNANVIKGSRRNNFERIIWTVTPDTLPRPLVFIWFKMKTQNTKIALHKNRSFPKIKSQTICLITLSKIRPCSDLFRRLNNFLSCCTLLPHWETFQWRIDFAQSLDTLYLNIQRSRWEAVTLYAFCHFYTSHWSLCSHVVKWMYRVEETGERTCVARSGIVWFVPPSPPSDVLTKWWQSMLEDRKVLFPTAVHIAFILLGVYKLNCNLHFQE